MTFSSFNLIVYTNLEVINPTFGFTVPFWFDFFSLYFVNVVMICVNVFIHILKVGGQKSKFKITSQKMSLIKTTKHQIPMEIIQG